MSETLTQMWCAAVEARTDATREALARAIHSAQWGRQPDGTFVTDRALGVGCPDRLATLWCPPSWGGKGRLASAIYGSRSGPTLHDLWTRDEALAEIRATRQHLQDCARRYEARRQEAGRRLRAGERLPFVEGCNGGYVTLSDGGGVSAPGALTAAGLSRTVAVEVATGRWGIDWGSPPRLRLPSPAELYPPLPRPTVEGPVRTL